jgi:hypothetical protein
MERTFIFAVIAFSLVMGVLVAVLGFEAVDGLGQFLVPVALAFAVIGFLGAAVASITRKQAARIQELENLLGGAARQPQVQTRQYMSLEPELDR